MKYNRLKKVGFYYSLIFSILIFGSLASVYIYHMVTKTGLRGITNYPFDYIIFQGQFFSFFTYQSNFLIGFGFLIIVINNQRKKSIVDNQNIRIALTSYISVTALTGIFFLLPGLFLTKAPFNYIGLLNGLVFHIVFPSSMIIYTLAHKEKMSKTIKQYYKTTFLFYLIYPIGYSLFLGFGFFFLFSDVVSNIYNLIPLDIIFPYSPFWIINVRTGEHIHKTLLVMLFLLMIAQILFIITNLFYVGILSDSAEIGKAKELKIVLIMLVISYLLLAGLPIQYWT